MGRTCQASAPLRHNSGVVCAAQHITPCMPHGSEREKHLPSGQLLAPILYRLCSVAGEPACWGLIEGVSHVQEYFVEDMIEVLMYVSRFRPQVLEGVPMEELLLFFVTFMGSPAYIKNPYLRSRMVEVTHGLPDSGASCAQVSGIALIVQSEVH